MIFLIFVFFFIFLEPPRLGGGGSASAAHLLSGQLGPADVDGLTDLTGLTALAVLVDLTQQRGDHKEGLKSTLPPLHPPTPY